MQADRTPLGMERTMVTSQLAQAGEPQSEENYPAYVGMFPSSFTQTAAYRRWRNIGRRYQLYTDEEIACFMMNCYDENLSSSADIKGRCTTCGSLLTLSCSSCGRHLGNPSVACHFSDSENAREERSSHGNVRHRKSQPVQRGLARTNDQAQKNRCEDGKNFSSLNDPPPPPQRHHHHLPPALPLQQQSWVDAPQYGQLQAQPYPVPQQQVPYGQKGGEGGDSCWGAKRESLLQTENDGLQDLGMSDVDQQSLDSTGMNDCDQQSLDSTGMNDCDQQSLGSAGMSDCDQQSLGSAGMNDCDQQSLGSAGMSNCDQELMDSTGMNDCDQRLMDSTEMNNCDQQLMDSTRSLFSQQPQEQEETEQEDEQQQNSLSPSPSSCVNTSSSLEDIKKLSETKQEKFQEKGKHRHGKKLKSHKEFFCRPCNKQLSSRQAFDRHVSSKLHTISLLPPEVQAKRRRRKKAVNPQQTNQDKSVYMVVKKGDTEEYLCKVCSQAFSTVQEVKQHRRQHKDREMCHLCGRTINVRGFRDHMLRHRGERQHSCPLCPKTFINAALLKDHAIVHSSEKPYCCEVCGACFRHRHTLKFHLRTHSGLKAYRCSQCDATFTRPRGLSDHMRVHTGEKPYGCQVCGRYFSSSGNLAAHRRKVHKMAPLHPNVPCRLLIT